MRLRATKLFLCLCVFSLSAFSTPFSAPAVQKLKPEDVVARHLASIGDDKARAAITTRIISGTSHVIFRTAPTGQASGRSVLASDGAKNLIGMSFPSPVYPREHLGFDGNSFVAAYVTPGVRSPLGAFLMTHNLIFKQGLMGGALSSGWVLSDLAGHADQLEYAGLKKIHNEMLHELRYTPRGGTDLKVIFFFDQQTFQHVRTEYERTIAAQTGDRSMIAGATREVRYKMIEEFSDFRQESGLTLPHTYNIDLFVDSPNGTSQTDWTLTLTNFEFNQKIDPDTFRVSAN
jgi:hypothetical protein